MSLTQEQRIARIQNLLTDARVAINTIYTTKVVEARQKAITELLDGLVLQVAEDARELVQEYGTQTHSYVQVDVYERILREKLGG
jgi:hypothetical protein